MLTTFFGGPILLVRDVDVERQTMLVTNIVDEHSHQHLKLVNKIFRLSPASMNKTTTLD